MNVEVVKDKPHKSRDRKIYVGKPLGVELTQEKRIRGGLQADCRGNSQKQIKTQSQRGPELGRMNVEVVKDGAGRFCGAAMNGNQ